MYKFNYWLLEHLDKVTGVARFKIGLMSGKSKDFMRHVLLDSHDIKMGDLMDICNTFHIPIGCFFYAQGTEPVTRPTPNFAYEAASFDMTLLDELLKGERGKFGIPVYKLMNAAGNEDCRLRKWTNDITRITARTLVDLCNGVCINMPRIIACPMKSIPSCFTDKQFADRCETLKQAVISYNMKYDYPTEAQRRANKRKSEEQMKQMADAISELQKALDTMQREQHEMKRKIEDLRTENRRLTSENARLSIAASPDVSYEKSDIAEQ